MPAKVARWEYGWDGEPEDPSRKNTGKKKTGKGKQKAALRAAKGGEEFDPDAARAEKCKTVLKKFLEGAKDTAQKQLMEQCLAKLKGTLPPASGLAGSKSLGTDHHCTICAATAWGQETFHQGGCLNCESHVSATCHETVFGQIFGEKLTEAIPVSLKFQIVNALYPQRPRFGANQSRNDAFKAKQAAYRAANPPSGQATDRR